MLYFWPKQLKNHSARTVRCRTCRVCNTQVSPSPSRTLDFVRKSPYEVESFARHTAQHWCNIARNIIDVDVYNYEVRTEEEETVVE